MSMSSSCWTARAPSGCSPVGRCWSARRRADLVSQELTEKLARAQALAAATGAAGRRGCGVAHARCGLVLHRAVGERSGPRQSVLRRPPTPYTQAASEDAFVDALYDLTRASPTYFLGLAERNRRGPGQGRRRGCRIDRRGRPPPTSGRGRVIDVPPIADFAVGHILARSRSRCAQCSPPGSVGWSSPAFRWSSSRIRSGTR